MNRIIIIPSILLFISTLTFLWPLLCFAWPIPDTGQSTSYTDTFGEDADYRINPPSFTKLDAQSNPLPEDSPTWSMIQDNVTGLIWEAKSNDYTIHDKSMKYNWLEAQNTFIAELNANAEFGFSDWRLPTLKELASIIDLDQSWPAINKTYFDNALSGFYWSSTSVSYNTDNAWGIIFSGGSDGYYNKTYRSYVRAVRGGQVQVSNSWVNNKDGTITDTSTGLMWQQLAFDSPMNWDMAINECESLTLAGYTDWRLPNREELRSIVDYSLSSPAINSLFFENTKTEFFWSSSTFVSTISKAWAIYFNFGYEDIDYKTKLFHVRGVRAGQAQLPDRSVILSPVQGALWNAGETVFITWDTHNLSNEINLFISYDGGKDGSFISIVDGFENSGTYQWTVPERFSVNCMIKLEPSNQPDQSITQGLFSIYVTPANLSGYITDHETNTPIPEVIVSIADQTVKTDRDGFYDIIIRNPGSYSVRFSKNGYQTKLIENVVLRPGNNSLNMDMIALGSVSGIITNLRGEPISNTTISIDNKMAQSNAQGQYTIIDLIPGTYIMTIHNPDYYSSTLENIKIISGQQTTVNCELIAFGPLNIVTLELPDAELNDDYQVFIKAEGGILPYTYSLVRGILPSGLNLYISTGIISGHIASIGEFVFTIGIMDAAQDYAERELSINITEPLEFETALILPRGTKNCLYSQSIKAIGGTSPYYFSKISGTFPDGITLSHTGQIEGTPVKSNPYSFTIVVIDSKGRQSIGMFQLQIVDPLIIHISRLNDCIVGQWFEQVLNALGGFGAYHWSVYSGHLPLGLSIDNETGILKGTPTTKGYHTLVFELSDIDGRKTYQDYSIYVTNPLDIQMATLPTALKNAPYYEKLAISGGFPPFTIQCEGLTPNLLFESETQSITGTSVIVGYNNVSFSITDSTWPNAQSMIKHLSIKTTTDLTILTPSVLPNAKQWQVITPIQLQAGAGESPYTWKLVKGYLPIGIVLDPNTGVLSGKPIDKGCIAFTIQVIDAQSVIAEKAFVWDIIEPLQIKTKMIPDAAMGLVYYHVLDVVGGKPPYKWRIANGDLPAGFILNRDTGTIYGTAITQQIRNVTFEVTDNDLPSQTIEKTFTINVFPNTLYIYTPELSETQVNQLYSQRINAMSGEQPYFWGIDKGQLPPNIQLKPYADHVMLEGKPTTPGIYSFCLKVIDSNSPIKESFKDYTITVYDELRMTTEQLQDIEKGKMYSDKIQVEGGKRPYIWRLSKGYLPEGLTLNPINGEISGTFMNSTLEFITFNIQIADSQDLFTCIEKSFTISVFNGVSFVNDSLLDATQYEYYQTLIEGTGGELPYSWTIAEGILPRCMALDSVSGQLYGTTSETGLFEFTIQLQDTSNPTKTASQSFSLKVKPNIQLIYGDMNNDLIIDLKDIIITLQVLSQTMMSSTDYLKDWVNDCMIDLKEVLYIFHILSVSND